MCTSDEIEGMVPGAAARGSAPRGIDPKYRVTSAFAFAGSKSPAMTSVALFGT